MYVDHPAIQDVPGAQTLEQDSPVTTGSGTPEGAHRIQEPGEVIIRKDPSGGGGMLEEILLETGATFPGK